MPSTHLIGSSLPRRVSSSLLCVWALIFFLAAAPSSQPTNLAINGAFEQADPQHPNLPEHWTTRHPDNAKRVKDALDPEHHGYVAELTGDEQLMGGYGADLTSEKIQFKPNTRYRCTGTTRSNGPKMIVFVKGYTTMPGRGEEQVYQIRKEIDPTPQWHNFELNFDLRPTREFSQFQHRIEYLRITLWAYWPAGTCWYDDIRFEDLGPVDGAQPATTQALTHAGTAPRLPSTQDADAAEFDEEQAFADAVNAFNANQDEQASKLAAQLLARNPQNADYHLLAARVLARRRQWEQSEPHARWLLDHAAQPWQREWAQVVQAEIAWRAHGDVAAARSELEHLLQSAQSDNARKAAKDLLDQLPR